MHKLPITRELYNGVGYVTLHDIMPSNHNCDEAIVEAARVSLNGNSKSTDRVLLRRLMRHTHTTPFEMVEFKWEMQMPIFIARQIIRHRTANVNEASARYSVLPDNYYYPGTYHFQATSNKQSSGGPIKPEDNAIFMKETIDYCEAGYRHYQKLLNHGISREEARMHLNLNICTRWIWKCDLHNTLHFLGLRAESHAQSEVRDIANAMISILEPIIPLTMEAWNDYSPKRGAMLFSALELPGLEADPDYAPSANLSETAEYKAKVDKLNFIV